MTRKGIHSKLIRETPFAIVDLETTGFMPKRDSIVEIAVATCDPGASARLAFDTLIDPGRSVTATEIHGITQEDVREAPRFKEVVGNFLNSISGCVVVAYNAYFDLGFLRHELGHLKFDVPLPFMCLMDLRSVLGIGGRCKLEDACEHHGISMKASHIAGADLQAAAKLLEVYLEIFESRGVETFGEIDGLTESSARGGRVPRFLQSFDHTPLPDLSGFNLPCCEDLVTRYDGESLVELDPERYALSAYSDALQAVLADLVVTDEEFDYLQKERQRVQLSQEQLRALHARFFASVISEFIDDEKLDNAESRDLQQLYACLSKLGWAPGE